MFKLTLFLFMSTLLLQSCSDSTPTTTNTISGSISSKRKRKNTDSTQVDSTALVNAIPSPKSFNLVQSTYVCINSAQVQMILNWEYESFKTKIEDSGITIDMIDSKFKQFFTLQYCDNNVLKELDLRCAKANESIANNFEFVFSDSGIIIK